MECVGVDQLVVEGRWVHGVIYIFDKLLLPCLEQYAQNNSILNIDNTVEYSRRNYQEYSRKQQGLFQNIVTRGVQIIKRSVLSKESADRRILLRKSYLR